MTTPIPGNTSPSSHVHLFKENTKDLVDNERINSLYSKAIDAILETLSPDRSNVSEVLESLTSLSRSYQVIQSDPRITKIATNALAQRKANPELVKSIEKIIKLIYVKELSKMPNVMAQLITLCEMASEGKLPKEAKYIRALAVEQMKLLLEHFLWQSRATLEDTPSELLEAKNHCNQIMEMLKKAGWKKEAYFVQDLINKEFKPIENAAFNEHWNQVVDDLCSIAKNKDDPDAANKMNTIVDEFIPSQEAKIIQDPEMTTKVFELCKKGIEMLAERDRKEEAAQLLSLLGNTMKDLANDMITRRKEEIIGDHAAALQMVNFCNTIVTNLKEMGATKSAEEFQSLFAHQMKGIAEEFVSQKKTEILENPNLAARAVQLCSMAAGLLTKIGLSEEASATRALTKSISFKEQSELEELINNNKERIASDPAFAIQMHELCDKTAHDFVERGLVDNALQILSLAANTIPIHNPQSHPLHDLKFVFEQLQKRELDPELGARFDSLDTGILKGGSLCVKERNIDNKMTACIDFAINPVRRGSVGQCIEGIEANPEGFYQSLPEGLCKGVKIHQKPEYTYKFAGQDKVFSAEAGFTLKADVVEIEFEGLGKVSLTKNTNCLGLYNTVSIELENYQEGEKTLKKLNQMMTSLGLGPILQPQGEEAIERIKIGQLYKAYYPAKSYILERTRAFYELPVGQLREKILSEEPGMDKIFKKYLIDQPNLMVKEEIYPGESIWTLADYSDQLKEKGALCFVAMLNVSYEGEEGMKALKSIIKMGVLSSKERFQANIKTVGLSSATDIHSGSGGEVFSRLMTTGNIGEYELGQGSYVLFDLSIANRVTYAWDTDLYGSKLGRDYSERENLVDLLEHNPDLSANNEHMSKKRIQPEKLRLMLNKNVKETLIEELSKDRLIEEKNGVKHIKRGDQLIPVDEMLIETRPKLTPDLF